MFSTKNFLFLLVLFSIGIFAQNSEFTDSSKIFQISDVVVTATRTEKRILEIANSISFISSDEIQKRSPFSINDVISSEYGLNITRQGGLGSLSNVFIRGGNSNYVLVLVDGMELNLNNDPSSVFDFSSLPVDNIERIEILRGQQSTLYGSDAMSGVINIITKKGSGKPDLTLHLLGGSYKTYKFSASSSGVVDKLNYSLNLSRTGSDGISAANESYGNTEKDGYKSDNVIGNIGYSFSSNFNNNLFFRYIKSQTELDQSGIYGDDPTYLYNFEEINFNNLSHIILFDNYWNQRISLSFYKNIRKYKFDDTPNNPASSRSLYDGKKYKLDWQNNFNISNKFLLSLGMDYQYEDVSSEYYYVSSFSFNSIFPKNNSKLFGLYLLNQFNFSPFFTSFGIRFDKNFKYKSVITYQLAPAYMFWQTGTKLKATYGTGYKAPTLFYLYDPMFGNPDLQPEKSEGYDFGIEQFLFDYKLLVGVTYFHSNYTDMFGFDPLTFKAININKAKSSGIEFFSSFNFNDKLNMKINYTYTNSEDLSENTPNTERRRIRIPKYKLGFNSSYTFSDDLNLHLEVIYQGESEDIDFGVFPSQRVKLKSFGLVNSSISYSLIEQIRLFFYANNIFDIKYEYVYGYGTPGRNFMFGLSLSVK